MTCGILSRWILFRIADAEENLGESEVREAHLAKSLFFIRIGDKVRKFYYLALFKHLYVFSVCVILTFASCPPKTKFVHPGESLRTTQGDGRQNSCSWAKDGLGILYAATWIFLHGFRPNFQKH